jgi:hypothetical protein
MKRKNLWIIISPNQATQKVRNFQLKILRHYYLIVKVAALIHKKMYKKAKMMKRVILVMMMRWAMIKLKCVEELVKWASQIKVLLESFRVNLLFSIKNLSSYNTQLFKKLIKNTWPASNHIINMVIKEHMK